MFYPPRMTGSPRNGATTSQKDSSEGRRRGGAVTTRQTSLHSPGSPKEGIPQCDYESDDRHRCNRNDEAVPRHGPELRRILQVVYDGQDDAEWGKEERYDIGEVLFQLRWHICRGHNGPNHFLLIKTSLRPRCLLYCRHDVWTSALLHLELRPSSMAISFTSQDFFSSTYQAHLASMQFKMAAIGQTFSLVTCPPPPTQKNGSMV